MTIKSAAHGAATITNSKSEPSEATGLPMVFGMRLLLSISALLTLYLAPAGVGALSRLTWIAFIGFALHSAVLLAALQFHNSAILQGKLVYWLDVGWCALLVYCSGGGGYFFPFFFFVILTAAFHWGFDEGARITLASAAALVMATLLAERHGNLGHLLLRTTFVLALGYMIAYWGGLGLAQRRRLALLRDVSRLSNPRFGVDQTIASVLKQTRQFYRASNCLLLIRDGASDQWLLHTANEYHDGRAVSIARLGMSAAAPLLAFGPCQSVLYAQPWHALLPCSGDAHSLESGQTRWRALPAGAGAFLADLLDARSFISAPLPLRKGEGRIYVVSAHEHFNRADAGFLQQLAAQVFPVIENIELLDRLASDAAMRERQKLARDLHDSTIQPYIGLRHGLGALRQGVAAEHPLAPQIDKLLAMSDAVIGDMRSFAHRVRSETPHPAPELLQALRHQAQQAREFYGLAITVQADARLAISDRLAAEVFQIANEGMSNIRKHTDARGGLIALSQADGWLRIRIENDQAINGLLPFLPSSIAERAMALGGTIEVAAGGPGPTTVHVAIPV